MEQRRAMLEAESSDTDSSDTDTDSSDLSSSDESSSVDSRRGRTRHRSNSRTPSRSKTPRRNGHRRDSRSLSRSRTPSKRPTEPSRRVTREHSQSRSPFTRKNRRYENSRSRTPPHRHGRERSPIPPTRGSGRDLAKMDVGYRLNESRRPPTSVSHRGGDYKRCDGDRRPPSPMRDRSRATPPHLSSKPKWRGSRDHDTRISRSPPPHMTRGDKSHEDRSRREGRDRENSRPQSPPRYESRRGDRERDDTYNRRR